MALTAPLAAASPTLRSLLSRRGNESGDRRSRLARSELPAGPHRQLHPHGAARNQLSTCSLEVGYIGKILRNEFMLMNLDAVPYMTTLGGQSFAQAYAQVYQQMFFNGVSAGNVTRPAVLRKRAGRSQLRLLQGLRQLHRRPWLPRTPRSSRKPPSSDLWNAMNKAPTLDSGPHHAQPAGARRHRGPEHLARHQYQPRAGATTTPCSSPSAPPTGTA